MPVFSQIESAEESAKKSSEKSAEKGSPSRPRLGQINFVNCLPVLLPLTSGRIELEAKIVEETPANLNSAYSEGSLDLGAMSSFHYLSNEENFVLVPNISISTTAEVGSVLFFAKRPLKNGCRIVVPASSATSVALLQIYLAKVLSIKAEFTTAAKPDLQDETIDAALIIGDRALTMDSQWSKISERMDLGQWWSTNFKTPMVFGLWAARKAWFNDNQEAFKNISKTLRQACDIGLSEQFDAVLDQSELRTSLSRERLKRYFLTELDYRLEAEHLKGLSLFKEQLKQFGILK